jgi:hypothetical protein
LDGDLNSQSLELADQPSLLCLRVPKALEVVGAEVHVVDLAGEDAAAVSPDLTVSLASW